MSLPLTQPVPQPIPPQQPRPEVVPAPPEKGRGALWGGLLLLLAGAVGLWLFLKPKEPTGIPVAVRTTVAKRGPLEVRVRVTGQTSARMFSNVTAPKLQVPDGDSQMVLLKLAASGSLVRKGEVVAAFDPQSINDHLDDVEDQVKQKENDVEKKRVQQELDTVNLQQSLTVAKAALEKTRLDRKATEIRSEIDQEILRLAEEEATAAYKEQQADLDFQMQSQKADMRIAELAKEDQDRHLKRHQVDKTKFTINASMDGMVVVLQQNRPGGEQVSFAIGDRVYPGTTFARLIDPDHMQIEGTINQSESSHFRLGQDAVVRLDAYPGVTYKGKVSAIGALATGGRNQNYYIRSLPIRVWIDNGDRRVLPDLSGSAEILIQKDDDAIVVPAHAVKDANGKPYVEVKTTAGIERRPVSLGVSNGVEVAVESGLNEGDEVVLN